MEKQYPYNNIIENKLGDLPGADVNQLWTGMQAILEKNMPKQEKRRRFLGWFLPGKNLFVLGSISIVSICCAAFLYFSSKESTITVAASNDAMVTVNNTAKTNNPQNKYGTALITSTATTTDSKNLKTNDRAKANGNNEDQYLQKNIAPSVMNKDVANKLFTKGKANKSLPQDYQNNNYSSSNENNNSPYRATLFTASINQVTPHRFSFQPGGGIDSTPLHNEQLKEILRKQRDSITAAITKKKKDKGAYIGVMAGLDVSSVNFTTMKTGNNKGIIAGYSFNKRWSIETGLFWNKKRFVGNGNDFKPDNYTLPAGVEMMSVYGNNQLYEWPINIRFSIIPRQHNLFITAGLSSYFMKTESYEYAYQFNGQPGKSYSTYKNQSKDLFSVANLSLGYTHQLGRIGNIRIEPYLKIPVKNIGINNMQVVSTGLNVGLTRQIFK